MEIIQVQNSGIILKMAGSIVWVDVLHNKNPYGYPYLNNTQVEYLFAEKSIEPDIVMFTHLHRDHYSDSLEKKARAVFNNTTFITPSRYTKNALSSNYIFGDLGIEISMIITKHEGQRFWNVNHYSYLIKTDEKNVIVIGDAEISDSVCKLINQRCKPEVIICPFPWVCRRDGRELIRNILRPETIIVNHFPINVESNSQYYKLTNSFCHELNSWGIRSYCMWEPFSKRRF